MQLFLFILGIFTDEEFRKLQAGNTDCIEKLYYKYKTGIYNYLLYKLNNNEHDAYDILADTFEAVIMSVSRLNNQNNLPAWIMGIAGLLNKTEDSVASALKRMKKKLQITMQSYR